MRYCGNCHYDLDGLKQNAPCPECGAFDRVDKIPPQKHGYYSLVAACLYLFIASTVIFLYGVGPFTIAGNGSINLNRLPVPLVNTSAILSVVSLAYVLFRTVFAFDLSKMPKWNFYIMYPLTVTLSVWAAAMLNGLLWVLVSIAIFFLT